MREQQPIPEQQLDEQRRELVTQFGTALGLHPEFIAAVAADGQQAIIERAELVDETGGQARALLMVQQLGMFMQKSAEAGEKLPPGAILDAIELIAKHNDVDEDLGVMLLGSVLEVFQQTLRRLKRTGAQDGSQTRSD